MAAYETSELLVMSSVTLAARGLEVRCNIGAFFGDDGVLAWRRKVRVGYHLPGALVTRHGEEINRRRVKDEWKGEVKGNESLIWGPERKK